MTVRRHKPFAIAWDEWTTKEKTSTISKDLRAATIDRSAGSAQRDIERINRAADELNSEAEDVLRYQSRGLALHVSAPTVQTRRGQSRPEMALDLF